MSTYIQPIVLGLLVSLGLLYLLSLPVAIYQYRKHNGILIKKSFVFASFIIYMIVAWFLTLLPLPSKEAVAAMTKAQHNPKPFLFISTFLQKSGFHFSQPSTWLKALKHPTFYSPAFNLLLTLPFGVYLRKYFNRSFLSTLLLGFLLSFFYELTQYTGIYGIYPQAYRVADVDDIILNTLGTLLGFAITPILSRLLPTIEKEPLPISKQIHVGLLRRTLAYIIDLFLLSFFQSIFSFFLNILHLPFPHQDLILPFIFFALYFFLLPYLSKGKTLGQEFLKIKILSTREKPLALWQLVVRNGIVLFFTKIFPFISSYFSSHQNLPLASVFSAVFFLFSSAFFLLLVLTGLFKKPRYFYELLSFTRLTSEEIHSS